MATIRGHAKMYGTLYVTERATGATIGAIDQTVWPVVTRPWNITFDPAAFPTVKSKDDVHLTTYMVGASNPDEGFGYDGTVEVVFQ
jgi:hypothetical protein